MREATLRSQVQDLIPLQIALLVVDVYTETMLKVLTWRI